MFRWCAYCQHLIGEGPPLDNYSITHGICDDCAPTADRYRPSVQVLRAQTTFGELLSAGRAGKIEDAKGIFAKAVADGLTPTELLLGVLQPALWEIGRLWQAGTLPIAEEKRFTAFCQEALAALPPPRLDAGAASVLLILKDGNAHDLGVRMLCRVAGEAGVRCEAIFPSIPDAEALALCRRERPDMVGVSVSLREHVAAADELAQRISRELGVKVVLGGGAFRRAVRAPATETAVLSTLDDFRAAVSRLSADKELARRRSGGSS